MKDARQNRARAGLTLLLTAVIFGGGALVASAAPPPAPTSCSNTEVQNVVTKNGPTYTDVSSPTINFNGLSSGSSISWTKVAGVSQTGGAAIYEQGPSGVGTSIASVAKSSTKGSLLTLVVCTTAPASTTAGPTTTVPPASGCASGEVQNVVQGNGPTYTDVSSPTVVFTIGTSTITWTTVPGAAQTRGAAVYQQGGVGLGTTVHSAAKTTAKGSLLALVVCTTVPI